MSKSVAKTYDTKHQQTSFVLIFLKQSLGGRKFHYMSTNSTRLTLSNKESVAFSAPSGLPKGKEYLQKSTKLYSSAQAHLNKPQTVSLFF